MKKKLLSIALAVSLISTALCGCGKSSNTNPIGTDTVSNKKQHLTVWAWDKTFNVYSMKQAEQIYQKEHPDFELYIIPTSWDDIKVQLNTIMESGDYTQLPDIMLIQDFAFRKYTLGCPEMFTELTDSKINFNEFAEGKLGNTMVGDKHYGIPFDNGAEVAVYRTDILSQCGYTLKDLTDITWERFIEIGKDIYAKTKLPLVTVQEKSTDIIKQILQSTGKTVWDENGATNFTNNPELKVAIELYKEMYDCGVLQTAETWDKYLETFGSGNACGVLNGCWILGYIQTNEEQSGLWGVTNMPRLSQFPDAVNYSNQGGSSWAISSTCSNPELAIDFMASTFAGSKELYDILLPNAGALSTWLPASASSVYEEPQAFFGNKAIYSQITEFASKIPSVELGVYYVETNDELGTALVNICNGADIDTELQNAQARVKEIVGQ